MFVSINWIKEYVDLSGLDIKKLIESFTLATAEVEDIIVKGEDIKNVVTKAQACENLQKDTLLLYSHKDKPSALAYEQFSVILDDTIPITP